MSRTIEKLENAKEALSQAKLKVKAAKFQLSDEETKARNAARWALSEALLRAVQDDPRKVDLWTIWGRLTKDCGDVERYWRARIVVEAITGLEVGSRRRPKEKELGEDAVYRDLGEFEEVFVHLLETWPWAS